MLGAIGKLDQRYLLVSLLTVVSIVIFVYKLYVVHGERDTLVNAGGLLTVLAAATAAAIEPITGSDLVTASKHGFGLLSGLFVFVIFFMYRRMDQDQSLIDMELEDDG